LPSDIIPKVGRNLKVSPGSFLDVLLSDDQLLASFKLRTSWAFESLCDVHTIVKRIPQVRHTILSLRLSKLEHDPPYGKGRSPINRILESLATCPNLTTLEFGPGNSCRFNLDLISKSCLSLENLVIAGLKGLEGNLAKLANLRQLRFNLCFGFGNDDDRVLPFLFPLSSANSLTTWAIFVGTTLERYEGAVVYPNEILNTFVNLSSLQVDPLSRRACNFLAFSKNHIKTFKARVGFPEEIPWNDVPLLLSVPCLRTVEHLNFGLVMYDFELSEVDPIIRTITTNFKSVERTELKMGLDLKWCPWFASLRNLKELVWKIPYVRCRWLISGCSCDDWELTEEKATKGFLAAFQAFTPRPRVRIVFTYRQNELV
jgi:hypothetical protein